MSKIVDDILARENAELKRKIEYLEQQIEAKDKVIGADCPMGGKCRKSN